MTVAELIAELQQYPSTARVIVDGYEGGYDDVAGVRACPIRVHVHREGYFGPHEDARNQPAEETAILISGEAA